MKYPYVADAESHLFLFFRRIATVLLWVDFPFYLAAFLVKPTLAARSHKADSPRAYGNGFSEYSGALQRHDQTVAWRSYKSSSEASFCVALRYLRMSRR